MVSIIVPVYQAKCFLQNTVDSVRQQSCTDWELILVDDGSTDSSGELCDRLAEEDSRIIVVHKENGGVSSARNAGLDLAKGEWVMFLDSDDLLLPDCLKTMLSASDGMDLVSAGYMKTTGKKHSIVDKKATFDDISDTIAYIGQFYSGAFYNTVWAKLFRREHIHVGFPVGIQWGEDILFNLNNMKHCHGICILPECVYLYRVDERQTLSTSVCENAVDIRIRVFRAFQSCLGNDPRVLKIAVRDFVGNMINQCIRLIRNKKYTLHDRITLLKKWAAYEVWCSGEIDFSLIENRRWRMVLWLFRRKQVHAVYAFCAVFAAFKK